MILVLVVNSHSSLHSWLITALSLEASSSSSSSSIVRQVFVRSNSCGTMDQIFFFSFLYLLIIDSHLFIYLLGSRMNRL